MFDRLDGSVWMSRAQNHFEVLCWLKFLVEPFGNQKISSKYLFINEESGISDWQWKIIVKNPFTFLVWLQAILLVTFLAENGNINGGEKITLYESWLFENQTFFLVQIFVDSFVFENSGRNSRLNLNVIFIWLIGFAMSKDFRNPIQSCPLIFKPNT